MKNLLTILLLLISVYVYSQPLQDRAVGIWDFETTAFADSSGNGHTGTATGTVNTNSSSGLLGNYFETDGTGGDYVTLDDTLSLGDKFTISGWVYLDDSIEAYFFNRYYSQTGIYTNTSGEIRYSINNNYFGTGQTAPTGEWFHVALTYDNSLGSDNATFYYNGSNVDNSNETSTEINANQDWQFGANGNGSYDIDGRLDSWAAWREILDATTISDTLYKSGNPTYSSNWTITSEPEPEPSPEDTLYLTIYEINQAIIDAGGDGNNTTIHEINQDILSLGGTPQYTIRRISSQINNPTSEDTTTYDTRIEEINSMLGQGFNAFGVNDMGDNDNSNSWVDGEYWMAGQEGFDNLRLVFYSWDADNTTHMNNMVECIDSTLNNGMMAIIDNHWWPWLRDSVESEFNSHVASWYDNWYKTAQWLVNNTTYNSEQIVFELINEPYNTAGVTNGYTQLMDADDWNTMMQTCVDTIRAAAGDSFAIVVAPYHGYFNLERAHNNVVWPDDSMLIVTNHYYWPQWATQWGLSSTNYGQWENIRWFRDKIKRDFDILKADSMPVTLGEWGVYKIGDPSVPDSVREKYLQDFHNLADDAGFSWSMWDMNSTNGITTTQGGTTWETDMLAALKADERSIVPIDSTNIYQSDFSSGVNGWSSYTNNGASVTLSSENNKLKCVIDNSGSSTLDLRIISPTIPMRQDSTYRITFTISWEDSGDNLRTLAGDMDGSWSWVWYEDVPDIGVTRYEVYYQGYSTDLSNNFNFYLGNGETGTFYIEDLRFDRATIHY